MFEGENAWYSCVNSVEVYSKREDSLSDGLSVPGCTDEKVASYSAMTVPESDPKIAILHARGKTRLSLEQVFNLTCRICPHKKTMADRLLEEVFSSPDEIKA